MKISDLLDYFDRIKSIYKVIIIISILIFICLLEFILGNYEIFKSDIRGVYSLNKFVNKNATTEEGNIYSINVSQKYIDKIFIEFTANENFELNINYAKENKYGVLIDDERPYYFYSDLGFLSDNINAKVSSINLSIPKDVKIANVYIKNEVSYNIYLFIFTSTIYITIVYMLFNRKRIIKKLPIVAFILIMGIGITIIFGTPSLSRSAWDDQIHFSSMINVLDTNQNRITEAEEDIRDIRYKFDYIKTIEARRAIEDLLNKKDKNVKINNYSTSTFNFTTFAYTPGYILYKILTIMKVNFSLKYKLVKLLYLFLYTIIVCYAIKIVKKYKFLFFIIALIPTSIFVASNYNYDVFINSLLLLSFAYYVNIMNSDKVNKKEIISFIIITILGCLTKAIYGPILLLLLLIPKEKFANKKQCYLFRGLLIFITLMVLGTFILPTLISPDVGGDVRGGDTSIAGQIHMIVKHPISFVKVFIHETIFNFFNKYLSKDSIINFAYYNNPNRSYNSYIFMLILLAIGYITSCNDSNKKSNKERVIYLFILALIISFIWGAMYLSFTPVGFDFITGVQPRYFVPIIWPLIYMFITPKIKCNINSYTILCIILGLYILLYSDLMVNLILPFSY